MTTRDKIIASLLSSSLLSSSRRRRLPLLPFVSSFFRCGGQTGDDDAGKKTSSSAQRRSFRDYYHHYHSGESENENERRSGGRAAARRFGGGEREAFFTQRRVVRNDGAGFGATTSSRAFSSALADSVLDKKAATSSSSSSPNSRDARKRSKYENIRVPDPFALVQKELQFISDRMRVAVQTDLPALANAAEYFFKYGAEGKRMRPTVLLLMASALSPVSSSSGSDGGGNAADARARENVGRRLSSAFTSSSFGSSSLSRETSAEEETVDLSPAHEVPSDNRQRQRRLAEITELIHVASLLHDDVLDGSATRRGLRALNLEVGNKLAILAGDFLLARASVTLASLRNVEVIELLSRVLEHLVKGEVMQMTQAKEEDDHQSRNGSSSLSIERYIEKSYYKTASLIGNSAKAVALLGGHSSETSEIAERFGRHLGLAFQFRDDVLDYVGESSLLGKPTLGDLREGIATAPVLFAAEKFPELHALIKRRFKEIGDVERAAKLVFESDGIEMASNLANEHRNLALDALEELPDIDCEFANTCRAALREITNRAVDRKK